MNNVVISSPGLESIFRKLQEAPLTAIRNMLTDDVILQACAKAGHTFRERHYGPVVTVLHFLLQAIQRDGSFAGTWQEHWSNAFACGGASEYRFSSGGLAQARARLPRDVFDDLLESFRFRDQDASVAGAWNGFRLRSLDVTTLSMPREPAMAAHFGLHKSGAKTVRYPLATFASLLDVGTSLIVAHRFGPFDPGELKTATPLLTHLKKGDLLLADRRYSGSTTMVPLLSIGCDFLMRKNAVLNVKKLPVIQRLGRDDFITEIRVHRPARKKDPTLPKTVRVRIFRAKWTTPAGERLEEWFVTSLLSRDLFPPSALARLYHERWRSEISFMEFKTWFHGAVLRSKTVDNIYKEFAAHVLAHQLVRRLMMEAAKKHGQKPTEISFLHAARWVASFSSRMSVMAAGQLPQVYDRLLDAISSTRIVVRPGRLEPRALTRDWWPYPHLKTGRPEWRELRLNGSIPCLS